MNEQGYPDSDYVADEPTVRLVQRRKRFTLEQANRTLPLLRRIVADVVRTHAEAHHLHAQLTRKISRAERQALSAELDVVVNKLQRYVDELSDVGAELKDYQLGLIDFVSVHEGRDVYLCWKLGEDRIGHWHEIHTGFQGRQPVSILQQ